MDGIIGRAADCGHRYCCRVARAFEGPRVSRGPACPSGRAAHRTDQGRSRVPVEDRPVAPYLAPLPLLLLVTDCAVVRHLNGLGLTTQTVTRRSSFATSRIESDFMGSANRLIRRHRCTVSLSNIQLAVGANTSVKLWSSRTTTCFPMRTTHSPFST
jgi:hypothetical protein